MAAKKARVVRVSLDVGNRKVKGMGPGGRRITFSSVIADPTSALNFDAELARDGGGDRALFVRFEGRDYVVGDAAFTHGQHPTHLEDRSRLDSQLYRVLTATALTQVAPNGGEVAVVFSLPVSWYFDRERAKKALAGRYLIHTGGQRVVYTLHAGDMYVLPEGLGSIIYYTYNGRLQLRDPALLKLRMGVIDVGGLTTDFSTFNPGLDVDNAPGKSESLSPALFAVWDEIKRRASSEYRHQLNLFECDEAMKKGCFAYGSEDIIITRWVDAALRALADRIIARASSMWQGGKEVRRIVVTGGGGPYVFKHIQAAFPHAITVSDKPYFSNCEGAYRYAVMKDGHVGMGK